MAQATLQALGGVSPSERSDAENILAISDHFGRSGHEAGYRGCSFIHASLQMAEASGPIHAIVQSCKRGLRERIVQVLSEARRNWAELADQIVLLLDGAGSRFT